MFPDISYQKPLFNPLIYLVYSLGRVTKWLCGGLQIRIRGFKSLPALLLLIGLIFIIIVHSGCSANLIINEVMYDPEQNDNYNEWIELYNPSNQSINITGWSISDNKAEDFLEPDFIHGNGTSAIPPHYYATIADFGTKIYENFSIPKNSIRLFVDDSSIGNGLSNSKDKIILKNETGFEIDSIEWGYNYKDVKGTPANLVDTGHSLARYPNKDTDNTSNDFFEGVNPTPGYRNIFSRDSILNISLYPSYVPKIFRDIEYSLPIAVKIDMSNYKPNDEYQLKSCVIGNLSSKSPATQTWNGKSWTYSDRYTLTIKTDNNGNWSGWVYLRLNGNYVEYQKNIKGGKTAFIHIKIKDNESDTDDISKMVYLLDMDNSSSNGITGGYTVGRLNKNNTFLQKRIIIIENKSRVISGVYISENNGINEDFITKPGYYKIAGPVGSNYSLKILSNNTFPSEYEYYVKNINIEHGKHDVEIETLNECYLVRKHETLDIPLTVKNTGDFRDTYIVNIDHISEGWYGNLKQNRVKLDKGEKNDINLHIKPCRHNGCKTGSITISAISEKDIGEIDEITIDFEVVAPDLTFTNVKSYNERGELTNIVCQGEQIRIKAFLKNIGNENATNVNVRFYYDDENEEHIIGSKYYDSVSKYQKYPSVIWDTTHVTSGNHKVFIIVDMENQIDELDELNNERVVKIKVSDTRPNNKSKKIKITKVYYHTHSNVNNEFIEIYNPTDSFLNISGWYLTNTPLKTRSDQTKIIFPNNTTIKPHSYLHITQNASDYRWDTGEEPDFEYLTDSEENIPQMYNFKRFILGNNGESIALKNSYNHTVDIIVYGQAEYSGKGWNGSSIPNIGEGVVLVRNQEKELHVDTNTSKDWFNPRRYGIGQSDFSYKIINFTGEIKTFVSPDCSYEAIIEEIKNATESIYLNIYEFTNPFLCDEIVRALRRNISVYIFLEGSPIGGITDEEKFILNRIASNGGNIRFIVNDRGNRVHSRYIFNHAKYLIIDNKTVIVESCNWGKTGVPINSSYGNREWGIIIRNIDVAGYFLNVFLDDWNPNRCDSYSYSDMNLSLFTDFFMDRSVYKGVYKSGFKSLKIKGNFSIIPVFSPDSSFEAICEMIESAEKSICIQQLYIYKNWTDGISPFAELLINKSFQGVDIRIILNYNPYYHDTNDRCNITKKFFEKHNIKVKFVYTNWSYFTNVHNKGVIVDNKSVLISSINWNENSVKCNREAGVIVKDEDVAEYFAEVFFYDWNLTAYGTLIESNNKSKTDVNFDYENTIYIIVLFTLTFGLIAQDWRKRKWY